MFGSMLRGIGECLFLVICVVGLLLLLCLVWLLAALFIAVLPLILLVATPLYLIVWLCADSEGKKNLVKVWSGGAECLK